MNPRAACAMGLPVTHTLRRIVLLLFVCARPLAAEGREPALDFLGQLEEIIEIVRGLHSFLSGIALISETIGFATVLLFLGVILLSAGFTAVGVPKGAPSFIASLLTANILWALWNIALKASPGECVAAMIRSNLILMAPAAAAALAALATVRIRRYLGGLFRSRTVLDGEKAASLLREYQEKSARLSSSLAEDIISSRGGEHVTLSGDTVTRAGELEEILETIRSR